MQKYCTKKERQEHLESWKESGLSKNAYAKSAQINPRTFIGWTWRAEKKNKFGFVEVPSKMFTGNGQCIVIEKGSITIRVPFAVGVQELKALFIALGVNNDN